MVFCKAASFVNIQGHTPRHKPVADSSVTVCCRQSPFLPLSLLLFFPHLCLSHAAHPAGSVHISTDIKPGFQRHTDHVTAAASTACASCCCKEVWCKPSSRWSVASRWVCRSCWCILVVQFYTSCLRCRCWFLLWSVVSMPLLVAVRLASLSVPLLLALLPGHYHSLHRCNTVTSKMQSFAEALPCTFQTAILIRKVDFKHTPIRSFLFFCSAKSVCHSMS